MGESWKLLTVQFTFTAVTLTFVVFIFVNLNFAMDELKIVLPQVRETFDNVPYIMSSMSTASSSIDQIEDKVASFTSDMNRKVSNMDASVSAVETQMVQFMGTLNMEKQLEQFTSTLDIKLNSSVQSLEEDFAKVQKTLEDMNKMLFMICTQLGCAGN